MADIQKVIKGLECCSVLEGHCEKCPYETEGFVADCTSALAIDALELLKEQQPLEVVYDINPMTRLPVSFCPKCGEAIQRHEYGRPEMTQLFCSYCGQAVKWN